MLLDRAIRYIGAVLFVAACVSVSAMTANAQDELTTAAKPANAVPSVKTSGKVTVCKEIADNLECNGDTNEWSAESGFNLMFENGSPVGVSSVGVVIYRQDDEGIDVDFVNEYQQNVAATNRKFAINRSDTHLQPGTYSIYVIRWDRRETQGRYGNFNNCLAKMTLKVS